MRSCTRSGTFRIAPRACAIVFARASGAPASELARDRSRAHDVDADKVTVLAAARSRWAGVDEDVLALFADQRPPMWESSTEEAREMRALTSDGVVVPLSAGMVALSPILRAIQAQGYWTRW